MKRVHVHLTLMLILILIHRADTFAGEPVYLGLQTGPSFATATVSEPPVRTDVKSRTAYVIGGIVRMSLENRMYIQTGVRYAQKGAKTNPQVPGQALPATQRYAYLEFPLMLGERFGPDEKLHLLFGPSIAFLLTAKSDVQTSAGEKRRDIKRQTESTEVGLNVGIGGEHNIDPQIVLSADLQYYVGLSQVNKSTSATDRSSWYSRELRLLVGVMYSL